MPKQGKEGQHTKQSTKMKKLRENISLHLILANAFWDILFHLVLPFHVSKVLALTASHSSRFSLAQLMECRTQVRWYSRTRKIVRKTTTGPAFEHQHKYVMCSLHSYPAC